MTFHATRAHKNKDIQKQLLYSTIRPTC